MANAKQINELNEATSVSATTKVAVAQPNGTEAEAATVSTLAAGVGEVLNTGSFAELTYATSQGKNAIATVLTNKGVETAASETLIQMADKVNNLPLADNLEDIKLRAITDYTNSSLLSDRGSIQIVNSRNDFVLIINYIAYYVPAGYYEDYNSMIAASTSSISTGLSNFNTSFVCHSLTDNGQYLWYRTNATDYVKLTLDHNTKTIVSAENFTLPFSLTDTTYSRIFCADNDGILWINTGRSCNGKFWNTNNGWYSSESFYLQGSQQELTGPQFMQFINGKIIIAIPYNSESSYRLKYVEYSVNEETGEVSSGTYRYFNADANLRQMVYYDNSSNLLFYTSPGGRESYTPATGKINVTYNVYIVDIAEIGTSPYILQIDLYPRQSYYTSQNIVYVRGVRVLEENGVFLISLQGFINAVSYNKTNRIFSKNIEEMSLYVPAYTGTGDTGPDAAEEYCLTMFDTTGTTVCAYATGSAGRKSYIQNKYIYTNTEDKKIIARKRTINGTTVMYVPNVMSTALIQSGALDIDTSVAPPLPDEE